MNNSNYEANPPSLVIASVRWVLLGVLFILGMGALTAEAATLASTLNDPTITSSDQFGTSVAISDDYVFVGAQNDGTSGPGVGQAHLYDANTFALLHTFDDPVVTSVDRFGHQGAIDGDYILISDYADDTTGFNEGSAHVFDAVTGNLLHTFYNPASTFNGLFGLSVDIDGGKAIMGAPLDGVGKAYLFDASTGALLHSFSDPSPTGADSFGRIVAIDGNYVVIGDPLDDTLGVNVGRAHIFDATTGVLLQTLDNPFPNNDDVFGLTVDVDGANVLVTATGDDSNGTNVGQAYVFDATTGALLQTLDDPTPTNSDSLGNFGAKIDGSLAVIGASGDDTNGLDVGQAYVYDITTGLLVDTLNDPTPTVSDKFGWSVDINGTTIVVGSQLDDTNGTDVGQVHVFNASVLNTDPTVAAEGDTSADEGEVALNTGTVSDDDGDTVSLSASVGTVVNNNDGIWSWSFDTTDGPAENQTVTVSADDGNGGLAETTFELTVNNVAPIVGAVTVPTDPQDVNAQSINVSADFTDPADTADETYTCEIDYDDGAGLQPGTVSGTTCSGSGYEYAMTGVYTVSVTVTDKDGDSDTATAETMIVIYDPSGGFATGGGWIDSPAGAYAADETLTGKATFGFVSKYKKGASIPTGNTEFQFKAGDLNFKSSSYEWLVINQGGTNAQFKGEGTINGSGTYNFMLWATDDSTDTFRIKITEQGGGLVYDNGFDQALNGGSIKVHKK